MCEERRFAAASTRMEFDKAWESSERMWGYEGGRKLVGEGWEGCSDRLDVGTGKGAELCVGRGVGEKGVQFVKRLSALDRGETTMGGQCIRFGSPPILSLLMQRS